MQTTTSGLRSGSGVTPQETERSVSTVAFWREAPQYAAASTSFSLQAAVQVVDAQVCRITRTCDEMPAEP
jgi:hypothetical protein